LNALPEMISMIVNARVSLQRIGAFLLMEEIDSTAVELDNNKEATNAIEIENASFKWASADKEDDNSNRLTLDSMNLKVQKIAKYWRFYRRSSATIVQ
jgi:hypothetical protein